MGRRWMYRRWMSRRRPVAGRRGARARGCLFWLLVLVAVLILLSLLFGGFRKGTRAAGAAPAAVRAVAVSVPPHPLLTGRVP